MLGYRLFSVVVFLILTILYLDLNQQCRYARFIVNPIQSLLGVYSSLRSSFGHHVMDVAILVSIVSVFFGFKHFTDTGPIRTAQQICRQSSQPDEKTIVKDIFGEDVTHACIFTYTEYKYFTPFDQRGDKKPSFSPPFNQPSSSEYYAVYSEFGSGRKNAEFLLIHELASKSGDYYTSFSPGYPVETGADKCWLPSDEVRLVCNDRNKAVTVQFMNKINKN